MKTTYSNPAPDDEDDLAAEYAFDYIIGLPREILAQNDRCSARSGYRSSIPHVRSSKPSSQTAN